MNAPLGIRFKWHLIVVAILSRSVCAGNFVCSDLEIVAAAEQARLKSAIFWTGSPLQGDWYRPCPISVRDAQHSGGGATRFRFADGEVFDWSMTIEGPRELLLRDVIPHEVDHAVRASLVRHPIERWLDEGCATLFESDQVQMGLRETASNVSMDLVTDEWLSDYDYPANSDDVAKLYAVGFSLVEYLLSLNDASTLLEFQRTESSVGSRLLSSYGVTVSEFRRNWDQWRKQQTQTQTAFRCQCGEITKPLLVIWTANWCVNCRQFSDAWKNNPAFRTQLQETFHIHILNYDQHRGLALNHRIQHLPTFQTRSSRIIGFEGEKSLLEKLLGEDRLSPGVSMEQDSSPEELVEDVSTISNESSVESPDSKGDNDQQVPDVTAPNSESSSRFQWIKSWLPTGLAAMHWIGILGGTAASGGLAGFALAVLPRLLSRRKKRPSIVSPELPALEERRTTHSNIPFPRKLDEASELLAIRQSEGRVAVLDALRGMFLDDELEKLSATSHENAGAILAQLKSSIDQRVDEVAPLSTQVAPNSNNM